MYGWEHTQTHPWCKENVPARPNAVGTCSHPRKREHRARVEAREIRATGSGSIQRGIRRGYTDGANEPAVDVDRATAPEIARSTARHGVNHRERVVVWWARHAHGATVEEHAPTHGCIAHAVVVIGRADRRGPAIAVIAGLILANQCRAIRHQDRDTDGAIASAINVHAQRARIDGTCWARGEVRPVNVGQQDVGKWARHVWAPYRQHRALRAKHAAVTLDCGRRECVSTSGTIRVPAVDILQDRFIREALHHPAHGDDPGIHDDNR